MYQKPSLFDSGLGGMMAYGLSAIGLPSSLANYGYRIGSFFDKYA